MKRKSASFTERLYTFLETYMYLKCMPVYTHVNVYIMCLFISLLFSCIFTFHPPYLPLTLQEHSVHVQFQRLSRDEYKLAPRIA